MISVKKEKVIKDLLSYNRTELVTLNLFWIGFIIYTVSWTLSKTTQVNFIICQLFQLLGIALFIPTCLRLIRFRFDSEYQKIFFVLFLFWSFITVVRGIVLDRDYIKIMILDPWFGIFLYFAPVIMLFPKKLIYYKKVFDVIIILTVFYVVYDILYISDLMEPDGENTLSRDIVEYFSKTLSVSIAFVLLTYTYHSKPKLFYAFFILLLTIFFAMVRARRGLLFMTIGPLFFLYLIYFFNVKKKLFITVFSIVLAFILISVAGYLINQDIAVFELLSERGTEDTRSNVERYFYSDMQGMDWIIGRGMNGEYYSPTVSEGSYRGTMETDYLNIILKGGSISLLLLLLILIPPIILGIFYSKNTLSKVAGIWIFFWMINLYPSTVQVFTINYLLVWISAGICYSPVIRNLPENIFKLYFLDLK